MRQPLGVTGQGLPYKGRSDNLWRDLLSGGIRVPLLGSGSKRGGLGTFVEMSQAVMPVIEPGMFVLYFPVCPWVILHDAFNKVKIHHSFFISFSSSCTTSSSGPQPLQLCTGYQLYHGRVTPCKKTVAPPKVEVSSCQDVWIEVTITPMLMWMTWRKVRRSGTGSRPSTRLERAKL